MHHLKLTLAAAAAAAFATSAMAASDLTGSLPDPLKALYVDASQALLPSAYDNFTPPKKPWKWCHSESYQGNPWRVSLTNELKRLVDGLIASGDASSFEVSDSNGESPKSA